MKEFLLFEGFAYTFFLSHFFLLSVVTEVGLGSKIKCVEQWAFISQ